jgi:hypothetical protein
MRFLVVTHPRGGVHYATRFFNSLGYDLTAGQLTEDGGVGWGYTGKLREVKFKQQFDVILHQVRSPLDSVYNIGTLDYRTSHAMSMALNKFLPADSTCAYQRIKKGMLVWHPWNQLCERTAQLTYRVEDLRPGTDTLNTLAELLGFDPDAAKEIPTHWDANGYATNWDVLHKLDYGLAVKTEEMAIRYGYDI